MRKIIITLTAVLLAAITVQAKTELIVSSENKTIRFVLKNESTNVHVVFHDKSGNQLFEKEVEQNNYKTDLNLAQLPSGTYTLSVTTVNDKEIEIINYPILIKNDQAIIGEKSMSRFIKPVTYVRDDLLITNMLSLNKNTRVKAIIKNKAGKPIHRDSFTAKSSIGRRYNIKHLPKGEYSLHFYFDDEKIDYTFTK